MWEGQVKVYEQVAESPPLERPFCDVLREGRCSSGSVLENHCIVNVLVKLSFSDKSPRHLQMGFRKG